MAGAVTTDGGVVEAMLLIGAAETVYRRAGCGAHVLLLGGDEATQVLFDALSRECRVTQPVLPESWRRDGMRRHDDPRDPVERRCWLCDVIDGLGLDRPSVVADAALADQLLDVVRLDAGRIARVALVTADAPGEDVLRCAAGIEVMGRAALVISRPLAANDAAAIGRLVAFIRAPEID